jgi:hypothetical protein
LQRVPKLATLLCAALVPGSGYILRGASQRATFLLPAATATVVAAAFGHSVLAATAPGTSAGLAIPVGLILYGLLSLASVVGTWRMPEPRAADVDEVPPIRRHA